MTQTGEWLHPWRRVEPDEARQLAGELRAEVGPSHPLSGREVIVLGRRVDNDDVLVMFLEPGQASVAVVHLNWTGTLGRPSYPATVVFDTWEDWAREVMRLDADAF